MQNLTDRQRKLLSLIVKEYIESAAPIGSASLVRKSGLNLSSATIRNEMMELEDLGYIYQPHTSAGRVPSDSGYHYFVETMLQESELRPDEQRTILHQFHQIELDLDQWTQLAASVLSNIARNAALVSTPAAAKCKLKHVELVPVQDGLALLVIVLHDGHVRQRMISLPEGVSEDDLRQAASKLTANLRGMTVTDMRLRVIPNLSDFESQVRQIVTGVMAKVDQASYTDFIFEGLVLLLRQPEFIGSEKINRILEALQQKEVVATIVPEIVDSEGVTVLIGEEIKAPSLQECTVIVARYGTAGEVTGVLGVLGPKRMSYDRAIPAVRYVSRVLTSLLQEFNG